ncbi:MAG: DcaP family trimeric outer membrane transporter [Shewanella sp.]
MKKNTLSTAIALICLASTAQAVEYKVGGYIKASARTASGDVPFENFWAGGDAGPEDESEQATKTQFSAQESRLNASFTEDDITGFVEIDFISSAQGNGNVSNSYSPRLRHAYINYKGFTVGQGWSTMVNTSAYPETTNMGGPLVGESMVRQALVRYTYQNWQFALENPNTFGTSTDGEWLPKDEDSIPDAIVRYNLSGDWGNVSFTSLVRQLTPTEDNDEITFGGSIAGKILVGEKNDVRFMLSHGNLGRYFSTGGVQDIYRGEIETTTGGTIAYRHFFTEDLRSTLFYGRSVSDIQEVDRSHYGINIFTNLTPKLTFGAELGRYSVDDGMSQYLLVDEKVSHGASTYGQLVLQYNF